MKDPLGAVDIDTSSDVKTKIVDLIEEMHSLPPVGKQSTSLGSSGQKGRRGSRGIRGQTGGAGKPVNTGTTLDRAAPAKAQDSKAAEVDDASTSATSPVLPPLPPAPTPYHPPILTDRSNFLSPSSSYTTRARSVSAAQSVQAGRPCVVWIHQTPTDFTAEQLTAIYPSLATEAKVVSFPAGPSRKKRFRPDVYYDWQLGSCQIIFHNRSHAEKFLATFPFFPQVKNWGLSVPQLISRAAPWAIPAIGFAQKRRLGFEADHFDATDKDQSKLVEQVYDLLRPYGPIRQLDVESDIEGSEGVKKKGWTCVFQFVCEADADMFESDFQRDSWQQRGRVKELGIQSWECERIGNYLPEEPECPRTVLRERQGHFLQHPPLPAPPRRPNKMSKVPVPTMPRQPHLPWAAHNITAPLPVQDASQVLPSPPARSTSARKLQRQPETGYPMHGSTSTCGRWKVKVERSPDGEVTSSLLVATDNSGASIRHVPGSCVMPAPPSGPGSESKTGWIDLAVLHLHAVGPDVNAGYLAEVFSHYGVVHRASVMRDKLGWSTGHAYISFVNVDAAASAMEAADQTMFGWVPLRVRFAETKPPQTSSARTARITSAAPGPALRV